MRSPARFVTQRLGINFPASGGEYVYLTRAFGRTWGFMSGWTSFFAGFSAPIAAVRSGLFGLRGLFLSSAPAGSRVVSHWHSVVRAAVRRRAVRRGAGLVLVFTLLNLFGVRFISHIQNTLTSLKIVVIIVFIVLGIAIGHGNCEPPVRADGAHHYYRPSGAVCDQPVLDLRRPTVGGMRPPTLRRS